VKTIVHRIKLKDGARPEDFERWVREADYAACPDLPSVRSFSVHRATGAGAAGFHYFEIIAIDDQGAFDADMRTPLFGSLVARFSEMADVVDEIEGELLEPGYRVRSTA
jgi:hypothetical protein